ncbi:hypothetical protein HDU78_001014 [Chytriomyces hyalinus]|nr:hypothetical protein HDU78_001014 [Chytriomyces hyalinus]
MTLTPLKSKRSREQASNQIQITVYSTETLSNTSLTDADIKKIGRSASICDRGILELFDNDLRRDVIRSFHNKFINSTLESRTTESNAHDLPDYIEAAYSIGKWSLSRFRRLVEQLKEPCFRHIPEGSLLYDIESLELAMDAESAANEESADGEKCRDAVADLEVWERYAVIVEGKEGSCPDLDSDSDEARANEVEFDALRCGAVMHFRSRIEASFAQLRGTALQDALYLLPKFKVGSIILEMIMSQVNAKISSFILEDEVIPKLAILNIIQTENQNAAQFLESLLLVAKQHISKHTVNSMLEFSGHTQKSECVRIIIYDLSEQITSEGIATAFVPVAIKGADHYLALLELYCMDKAMQAQINIEMGLEHESEVEEDPFKFMEFVAASFYIFLFLAAAAGRAPPSTIVELIEFYSDPCQSYMPAGITPSHHNHFIAQTFRSACGFNLGTIAWALVEKGWTPHDICIELQEAVELGHQNIVHLLLESLLKPDEKMEPSCLPIVYRRSSALTLLPLVARRFPKEAAWFLEQLSCIPIPACIPPGQNKEAEVRAKPVHGVLLGTLSLFDTIYFKRQAGTGSLHVWPRLVMNGLLRQAGSGKDDLETESLICAAPESMLTADAVHTPLFGKSWAPSTSPFIRLLAEDDPQITLQPVMRALMEFHWARGRFWARFATQFLVWMIYVPCLAFVCITLVQKQNSGNEQYAPTSLIYYLSYVVLILSCLFILQEVRELHDYPKKYFQSGSNMLDTGIHFTILYVVIVGLYLNQYVQPILMSLILIFCAIRIITHLRVLPSVGPLVRLLVTASVNILPILIPYGVMALGFTIAFYIIQFEASRLDNSTSPHFETIGGSLQTVLTMAMTDYSVLDYASNPQVFLLRFLFYICFIIFLVNIIIALMTVNVADIHSNMNAAWLLEIAGIMVDLELFWPFPQRYDITAGTTHASNIHLDTPARTKNKKNMRALKRVGVLAGNNSDDPGGPSPGQVTEDALEKGNPVFFDSLRQKSIILYTWPQEFVVKTAWWPLMVCRALENSSNEEDAAANGEASRKQAQALLAAGDESYEVPEAPKPWDTFLRAIGFGQRNTLREEKKADYLSELEDVPGGMQQRQLLLQETTDASNGADVASGRRQTRKSIIASATMAAVANVRNGSVKKISAIQEEDVGFGSEMGSSPTISAPTRPKSLVAIPPKTFAAAIASAEASPKVKDGSSSALDWEQQQSSFPAIPPVSQTVIMEQSSALQQSLKSSIPDVGLVEKRIPPVRIGPNMDSERHSSVIATASNNITSIQPGDPYHSSVQGNVIAAARRPSVWTKLFHSNNQINKDPLTTNTSANQLENADHDSQQKGDGGNRGVQNSLQLDAIAESMKGMEAFMRQEAKANRERIKRLEELVETELRENQREDRHQKEEMAKLSSDVSRLVHILAAERRSSGQPSSARTRAPDTTSHRGG